MAGSFNIDRNKLPQIDCLCLQQFEIIVLAHFEALSKLQELNIDLSDRPTFRYYEGNRFMVIEYDDYTLSIEL